MQKGRMFILVLVCLALMLVSATPISALPTWIPVDGKAAEEKPSVVVQRSNDLETVIEVQTKGFSVEEVMENKEAFQVLRLPYYYTTLEIGKPQLPAITEMIGIPGTANVKVTVVDSTVVTLKGYKAYPFQTPLREGQERVGFDIDSELYSQSRLYPEMIAEVDQPGIWRDIRVVNLRVCPVRYSPATGDLKVYTKLTIKLEYYGTSETNLLTPRERPISASQNGMYRGAILNYDFLSLDKGEGSKQDYDLLIIAVHQLVDEMQALQDWKNLQGVETQITDLTDIAPATTDNIKNHIAQEYEDHNINYVLLVGDMDDLPIYDGYDHPDPRYSPIISDYWYALLDGDDDWPDIAVGRISATTAEGNVVENIANKIIAFENDPAGDWLDNALLVAHRYANFLDPDAYRICKEDIRNATDTPSGTYRLMEPVFTTAYGAEGASNADVSTAINDDGQVVVNYRGHGDVGEWGNWNIAGESFTTARARALTNGDMTPVVLSIACWNNKLDEAGECLGEAFTKADDAAVAFLGASRPSYTTANHTYDKQSFSAVFDEGYITIGNASNLAAIRMIQGHGNSGLANARMYLWLGDPSLTFALPPPDLAWWLVLIDVSGSMGLHGRIDWAKENAITMVTEILQHQDHEVALATFAGDQPFNLLLDWTRNQADLINEIEALTTGGLTPLGDAACAAADMLINDVPIPPHTEQSRRLVLLTDGGENRSEGWCAGEPPWPDQDHPNDDDEPNPPWCNEDDSWHCRVLTELADNLILDVGYFGNLGGALFMASGEDFDDFSSKQGDSLFLAFLADTTGGSFCNVADTAICGNGILEPGEDCEVGHPCGGTDDSTEYVCINCQCVPVSGYNATIQAYCHTCDAKGAPVSVSITMDGTPTGYNTPHTFPDLTGIHTFTVPNTCPNEHAFQYWHTGETSQTITVTSAGTYVACYQTLVAPTLTEWGVIVLVVLILFSTWMVAFRRKKAVAGRQ